jgi:hypothetical protein
MRHTTLGWMVLAALFAGCGGPAVTCPDGSEPIDGMCPDDMEDGGMTPEADAGMTPEMDGGMTPEMDGGMTPEMDGGMTPEMDAGMPDTDAGPCTTMRRFYADGDGDGFGNAAVSVELCAAPPGFVTDSTDCDDACAACFPGNAEVCDGEDNNCNATTDEGVLVTFYRDSDGDGHGVPGGAIQACTAPSGFAASSDDCNDACAACFPGNAEVCDGNDNNCNSTVDEGVRTTFYRDADGDGYGLASSTMQACSAPSGYVSMSGDCNDSCATCHPGRTEVCDGNDNNCNSMVDEGVRTTFYRDNDADGYGSPGMTMSACTMPAGYVANNTDCNDMAMSIRPGATEICNATDDNCSGAPDESFACVRGTPVSCTSSCGSMGTAACSSTCTIPTGAACSPPAEVCNGVDDDCDGTADEQLFALGTPRVDSYAADFARPEAFTHGTNLYSFWHAGGTVSGWRHSLDGAPTVAAQVPLGGTANYDANVSSVGTVAWAHIDAAGDVVVRRIHLSNLTTTWSTTIAASATQVQIAVGTTHVFVFTIEGGGNIYRRRLDVATGALMTGAELIGDSSGAFALADDGVDRQYLAYRDPVAIADIHTVRMQGNTTTSVLARRLHTAPNLVDDLAIASAWVGSDPELVVAYSTFGGGASAYNVRYVAYRASMTGTGVITAQATSTGSGPDRSRLDLEYANNTYLLAGSLTTTIPPTANGIPVVAQLNTRAGSAILDVRLLTSTFVSTAHESVAVVRYPDSVAQPDRLFYNPAGANGIASVPSGCF